tara:strand:+ start:21067 stop:21708 length:642 start_codon:yes stop_codon:yes gene_type:complete
VPNKLPVQLMDIFEAKDLICKRETRTLFCDLNFTLKAGELLQIIGANGTGKSSLLGLLTGLLPKQRGTVTWQGNPLTGCDFHFLGHRNGLKAQLTVLENLRCSTRLRGNTITRQQILTALGNAGLSAQADVMISKLSAGLQRRVALTPLQLAKAPIWILDEPLTALDKTAQALFAQQLTAHLNQGGLGIIATHQSISIDNISSHTLALGDIDA